MSHTNKALHFFKCRALFFTYSNQVQLFAETKADMLVISSIPTVAPAS